MFKILLKLKKAWKSVLIVVVLLIVQAMGELALPDYTSKIVNVGIQQGGIESCVPDAIREASMQNILLATEDDDYILDIETLFKGGGGKSILGHFYYIPQPGSLENILKKLGMV